MSLFGAIGSASSGLTVQLSAFCNIHDDVASTQTAGFKRLDTRVVNYLTTTTPTNSEPASVVAHSAKHDP
jgi:flagellar basal body rod protein FlgG